jgi:hypothetical protein
MIASPRLQKTSRNLRAIFLLGFILTLLASVVGGYILVVGHSRPDVTFTMPAWKYGQFLMFLGLTNLFVIVCLFIQFRKLTREVKACKDAQSDAVNPALKL